MEISMVIHEHMFDMASEALMLARSLERAGVLTAKDSHATAERDFHLRKAERLMKRLATRFDRVTDSMDPRALRGEFDDDWFEGDSSVSYMGR